jgi:predicted signal transduction protein with EAL and GGDEF domain
VDASIGASIGIAIFPQDGKSLSPLLNKADQAMYRVKSAGKGNYLFIGERQSSRKSKNLLQRMRTIDPGIRKKL